jgi:hypothetical protein
MIIDLLPQTKPVTVDVMHKQSGVKDRKIYHMPEYYTVMEIISYFYEKTERDVHYFYHVPKQQFEELLKEHKVLMN